MLAQQKKKSLEALSLFGQTFLVTQFSSLITHHSSLKNTMFVWHHHSLPITQYFSHYLWARFLSLAEIFFSPLFFLLSLFFSSFFFHFSFFSLFTFLISDFSSRTKLNMHKYIPEQTQISQSLKRKEKQTQICSGH